MVLIKEFRVVLPCSVQEYQVGQLYSVAEASKNETGGGEGIEVLKNEPYEKDGEKGQYTHKIYHLKSKVPAFVRMIAPEGSLVFHEKAWNAYPYCRTIVTNEYMKDDFFIKIETWHKPDLGTLENVHGLDPNTWKTVEIVHIDIADRSQVEPADYKADEDPALFQSVKTKRGPLGPNWKKELASNPDCPQMCAYKLVTIKFKWWGLQSKVENFIQKVKLLPLCNSSLPSFFCLQTAKTDASRGFKGLSLEKSIVVFGAKCFPDGLPSSSVERPFHIQHVSKGTWGPGTGWRERPRLDVGAPLSQLG
ncbi:phosphatidylinositol transfer protein beta isoform isoform X1 [Balaenoptera musculus]|uniref:Phosphatidylinositol transfer protein beta isoform n=1 Tax=Balaenoptera musculus TaxID=9771 RepID=A0A8B8ZDF5_BALMU|nr:phosphatidylinositol transfer protein beta isoform isoform X1 [Balaenoptera musculus]